MEQEKQLSGTESMEIITRMINTAKGSVRDQSFYFLLWGWIVILGNLGHYYLAKFTDYEHPYIVWSVAILGFFVSMIHGFRSRKERRVITHVEHILNNVWYGFLVVLVVILVFMSKVNFNINPLLMLIMALATYVTGIGIKFRPMVLGGLSFLAFAVVAFLVDPLTQSLVMGFAVILGYLIPGYMLRKKESIHAI